VQGEEDTRHLAWDLAQTQWRKKRRMKSFFSFRSFAHCLAVLREMEALKAKKETAEAGKPTKNHQNSKTWHNSLPCSHKIVYRSAYARCQRNAQSIEAFALMLDLWGGVNESNPSMDSNRLPSICACSLFPQSVY
jgi:hypothetical protein